MKRLALDLGDVWVGSAISDFLGITARPYQTIKLPELISFLEQTLAEEEIETIIVGLPTTFKGTESEQTKKIRKQTEELEKKFTDIKFKLWDERLTSKRASNLKQGKIKTKEAKQHQHSIAAAFILQSYLDRQANL